MKKKRDKSSGRRHIGHSGFLDRNVSSLDDHPRAGKTLKSPFSRLSGKMRHSSWYDECLPNILWACILSSFLEREECLSIFRAVVTNASSELMRRKETFITHNFLATLDSDEFDILLAPVLARPEAVRFLSALTLVDSLPDFEHWRRVLPSADGGKDWSILIHAVADTFDHQSERATDVRWFKLVYFIVCREGMFFSEEQKEIIEEFRLYPNKGDMHKVRPSIRSAEMAVRDVEFGTLPDQQAVPLPPSHIEAFWAEVKSKTDCIILSEFEGALPGPVALQEEVIDIFEALDAHFHATDATTAVDARHDGAFGLVLYSLTLLLGGTLGYSHTLVEGRLMLRTVMECFVTLRYLTIENNDGLWLQYRRYGSGQAKLAFLKNVRDNDVPGFIDLSLIEKLANEDMWMEFNDIELGNWAKRNLREMSEKAGVKEVYDKYYDWSSGYSHGHWICVRDTAFVNCMNPLHRFHRIPAPPKINMPSFLPDACRLVNRMLDDLNCLYPSFDVRLKWHKHQAGEPLHEVRRELNDDE